MELLYRRRRSKLALALARTQLFLGVLVHWALPSRLVAKVFAHSLSNHGPRTLAGLTGLMRVVRVTALLHQGSWELNLTGAKLHSLTLDGTGSRLFEGAALARAELDDVRLLGLFARANFDRTEVRRCSFLGFALSGASFRRARLEDAVVVAGQASECDFDGAELTRCTITEVTLGGSSFDGATLREVVFERCDLTGVLGDGAAWENVDLVDCTNVSEELAALPQVTVIDERDGADAAGSSVRTTLGAAPRSLSASGTASGGARERMIVRYAGASTRYRPPLGYRLETLARLLGVWAGLGSNYWEARRRWRSADGPFASDVFPRNRPLFALKVLVGSVRLADADHPAAIVFAVLTRTFEKRYAGLEGATLPELIFVDGNRPVAKYVDVGSRAYIVMSMGMEVMTIRLARYCIAWMRPEAVAYMDEAPEEMEPEAIRAVLRRDLEWIARSGDGDIAGVGRIQLTGRRHAQATYLALTFLAFVLAHEMAHFLHARGLVDLHGGAWGAESEADILAAEVVAGEEELDGDAALVDSVKNASVSEIRHVLRHVQREMGGEGFDQLDFAELSDEELKGLAAEAAPDVSRFAESNWHAAAIAALILILGGSVDSGRADQPGRRITTIMRTAFGEEALASLETEIATEGSILHLLNDVFSPPKSRR